MINQNPMFIVYDDLSLGGIQIKILDIIKETHRLFPNKKIILCLIDKKGIWLQKLPSYVQLFTSKKITLKGFRKFNNLIFVSLLILQIIRFQPKTIIAFMNRPAFAAIIASKLLFLKKIKILIGQDCTTSTHISSQPNPKINCFLIKTLYPLANKILVQTPTQKNDLIEKFSIDSKKIELSPNWLPLNFSINRCKNNIKKTDITFIGRLDPQKNLKKFIDIVFLIKKQIPNIKAKIIGSGSESEMLKRYAKKLSLNKNIEFFPAVLNPKKFYSESKIYLLTSHYEGFPLTMLEAISQNCIPIFFNIKEVSSFFTKFKNFIKFNSNQKAASKIIFLLNNQKTREKIFNFYSEKIYFEQKINLSKLLKLLN